MNEFHTILQETRDTERRSDLTNLANALLRVQADMKHARKRLDDLSALHLEIEQVAGDREAGDVPYERIKDVYERSQGYDRKSR
jgi:hypothetical protein